MMQNAFRAIQSAFPRVSHPLLHKQTMAYFKTPHLFVKSAPLSDYFTEKIQADGKRRIEKIAQTLATELLKSQAEQGKTTKLEKMLDNFYKEIDVLIKLKYAGPLTAELQNKRQDFKEHLKVFLLLQIKFNKDYAQLKDFGQFLSNKQQQIANKIINLISEAPKILKKENYPSIREMLLIKLGSKEFQVYPQLLVDEFRRLFDFDMPFVIDREVQKARFNQGSIKGFNTFCPTLTVTTKIFNLLNTQTCFVVGSNGTSYSEFLLRYLKKYTQQRIFYIGNILECGNNKYLAKQLFQSCWGFLSPDDIDALSGIYCQQFQSQPQDDDRQFEIILGILKRKTPSVILIDQCNYLASIFGKGIQQTVNLRFQSLIKAALGSTCIFSSSKDTTEDSSFKQLVRKIRRHPPQQCDDQQLKYIFDQSDQWAIVGFEMEKQLRDQRYVTLEKQQINQRLTAILQDKDIKIAFKYLKDERFFGNKFHNLSYLASWLLYNNKQTIQKFDLDIFKLMMKKELQ